MLSQTNKICRVVKGEIFQQGPWTRQNFDPLRCFPLVSSQTKAFKPPKLNCIRNTSLDRFLSNTISKWLAIKISQPAASLCIQDYIQPTQELSVWQQTLYCPFWSWWGLFTTTSEGWGLTDCSIWTHALLRKKKLSISPFSKYCHVTSSFFWRITRSWEQVNQTYVNIYLVGVWN